MRGPQAAPPAGALRAAAGSGANSRMNDPLVSRYSIYIVSGVLPVRALRLPPAQPFYVHTCTHARTHARTHTYTHTHVHIHTGTHIHPYTYVHTCTHIHMCMYTHTHTCTHMYTLTHTHTHTAAVLSPFFELWTQPPRSLSVTSLLLVAWPSLSLGARGLEGRYAEGPSKCLLND